MTLEPSTGAWPRRRPQSAGSDPDLHQCLRFAASGRRIEGKNLVGTHFKKNTEGKKAKKTHLSILTIGRTRLAYENICNILQLCHVPNNIRSVSFRIFQFIKRFLMDLDGSTMSDVILDGAFSFCPFLPCVLMYRGLHPEVVRCSHEPKKPLWALWLGVLGFQHD